MTDPRAFNHVGITVTDIDAAVRWYRKVFGCTVVMPPMDSYEDASEAGRRRADLFGKGYKRLRLAHLCTAEGVGIELFQFFNPRSTRRKHNFDFAKTGIFHICLTDPDIRKRARTIVRNGGRQRSKVWKLWSGKPYEMCYCEDPWGNVIELNSHPYVQIWANYTEPHKR